ncbi:MAG: hypothetical protein BWY87_00853 [Deltaproteobacteria bacterium ADurb.Bin510]|nr:MAG: hypothetical protein BWY87_00853 [Deltaproteobacteria bacterium ADurb.Bin510]
MTAAPPAIESGIRLLWLGPLIMRTRCGTMSPIQPMMPLTETAIVAQSVALAMKMKRSRLRFTPRSRASSSPILSAFRRQRMATSGIVPRPMPMAAIVTICQSARAKLPISQ